MVVTNSVVKLNIRKIGNARSTSPRYAIEKGSEFVLGQTSDRIVLPIPVSKTMIRNLLIVVSMVA